MGDLLHLSCDAMRGDASTPRPEVSEIPARQAIAIEPSGAARSADKGNGTSSDEKQPRAIQPLPFIEGGDASNSTRPAAVALLRFAARESLTAGL
jgi:hypothetical protein